MRGGMTGSAWKYGIKAFLFTILNAITLNLASPWTTLRLTEDRFNHSYFGNAKASLQAPAGPLYLTFILGFVFTIIGIALLALVIGLAGYSWLMANDLGSILAQFGSGTESSGEPELTEQQANLLVGFVVVCVIAFYLGIAIVSVIAFAPYMAAFFRTVANNLQLAELRFSSEVTAWRYIRLWIGNIVIVVLTLGLGLPVAVHRSLKFFADRVTIHGELDVERLQQSSLERPKVGEGLLEAFDPGFF
jgi:uncharacterized membrane protein YjgN (DUF898 family)